MEPTMRPRWRRANPAPPVPEDGDPLGHSVQHLGKKWTLLLLRDLAFLKLTRFSEFLNHNRGLTPRVLSRRLREMQAEGLIVRTGRGRRVTYSITHRGEDAVFILLAYLRYGQKHQSDRPTGRAANDPHGSTGTGNPLAAVRRDPMIRSRWGRAGSQVDLDSRRSS
jgi:DNA-binding HxlR family transcriptional regulator